MQIPEDYCDIVRSCLLFGAADAGLKHDPTRRAYSEFRAQGMKWYRDISELGVTDTFTIWSIANIEQADICCGIAWTYLTCSALLFIYFGYQLLCYPCLTLARHCATSPLAKFSLAFLACVFEKRYVGGSEHDLKPILRQC